MRTKADWEAYQEKRVLPTRKSGLLRLLKAHLLFDFVEDEAWVTLPPLRAILEPCNLSVPVAPVRLSLLLLSRKQGHKGVPVVSQSPSSMPATY